MIYVFVGPSASGKTEVSKFFQGQKINFNIDEDLMKNHVVLPKNITSTTRVPRGGEKHGVDYYFLLPKVFVKKIDNNEFAEYAEVFGKFYGLEKKELEKHLNSILVYDPQGVETLKKSTQNIVSIYFDISAEVSLERMIDRKDNSSDIEKRMKDLQYFLDYKDKCDHVVDCNRDINLVIKDINNIIEYYN